MKFLNIVSVFILVGCYRETNNVVGPGGYLISEVSCSNSIENCRQMAGEDCIGPYYSIEEKSDLNGYLLDYTCSKSQFEWIRRVQKDDSTFTPSSVCESSN